MKLIIFTTLFSLISCFSCKHYLDPKNSNAYQVPTSIRDLQEILDDFGYMNELRTPSYAEAAADDYFLTDNNYKALLPERKLLYQWEAFDYSYPNDWSAAYLPIYNVNFCLEVLDKIERTEANNNDWKNVYGSAHFYRAYYFLQLLWTYAPAFDPGGKNDEKGIVLRLKSDFNVKSEFSPVEECYQQVLNDAKVAVANLQDLPLVKSRPSKAGAYALLARAYLSMGLYEQAGSAADESLKLFESLMDYNRPEDGIKINAAVPFSKFTKETIFYSEMGQKFPNYSPNRACIDSNLMNSYDSADLRRIAFFTASGEYFKFKGTYSHSVQWMFSGLTSAEMLLIRAESNARKGDLKTCVEDINLLLKHRWDKTKIFVPRTVQDRNEALRLVLSERRKELLMRGIRLSDIKRLNLEGANIKMVRTIEGERLELSPNSSRLVLNVPTDLDSFLK
ncbi:RagB/SusD family nutrient uptake outer membrane protein [Sphingobacterium sp. DR205]|uniref:RagB/SusD family nutrient uptake outer membrane protein n=1 Tax=Sphingobacterium sp. DR205 TaxID=2713573 RepID=UPI0013E50922|nr:RagB/SusD family nutrient uptake outer membrane protein [Sphingobacterium sp. DR205]QIH35261.1 RagB/SusD family nutrient uptake outer membrane protein [Sphingobacterium sp. DR205]